MADPLHLKFVLCGEQRKQGRTTAGVEVGAPSRRRAAGGRGAGQEGFAGGLLREGQCLSSRGGPSGSVTKRHSSLCQNLSEMCNVNECLFEDVIVMVLSNIYISG